MLKYLSVFTTKDGLTMVGNNNTVIRVRFVREIDAQFILDLRTDQHLNKFLSPTSRVLENQQDWIRNYMMREALDQEFYFMFTLNEERLGTIRLYDIDDCSCTYGSWLFIQGVHPKIPLVAESLAYEVCFNVLSKQQLRFDVRLDNVKVVNYHKLKKLKLLGKDNLNAFYSVNPEEWTESKKRIEAMLEVRLDVSKLGNSLQVECHW